VPAAGPDGNYLGERHSCQVAIERNEIAAGLDIRDVGNGDLRVEPVTAQPPQDGRARGGRSKQIDDPVDCKLRQ
jgi:hypothetical protein